MIAWTIQTLIASSILMAIVLMLRAPVSRAFGARSAYALWLLPVLRMILSPLPGWRSLYVPVLFWGPEHKTVGLTDPASAARLAQEMVQPAVHGSLHLEPLAPLSALQPQLLVAPQPASPIFGIGWSEMLLAVWIGGAVLWFGWQMLRYRAFLGQAMRASRPLTRECGIDVLLSDRVDGPVAAGIVKRRIFLPGDFMKRYSAEERRLALVHEAAHHDRFDVQANLVGLAVLALHWWNPLAHRAYRAFRADQELACDATVLADAQAGDRFAYGTAVLKSASARMPGVACALSHKAQLQQRITMMARKPIGASRLAVGGMVAVAAIGGGLLLTASGSALAQDLHLVEFTGPAPARVEAARVAADHAAQRAEAAGRRAEAAGRRAAAVGDRVGREAGVRAEALSAEADRHAAITEQEAEKAGSEAALAGANAEEIQRTALASARSNLATQCAAAGTPIDTGTDWASLATCGHLRDIIRTSLRQARDAIASSSDLTTAERAKAMAEIDRSATDADREVQHSPSF